MRRNEGGERTRYQRNALPTAVGPIRSIAREIVRSRWQLLLFAVAVLATGWDVVA